MGSADGSLGLDPVGTIVRKRDGEDLDPDELRAFLAAYGAGDVGDEQVAALLMAGVIRGFSEREAVALTAAFVESGTCVDLGGLPGPTVDKHSTGGVGDTTTLIVGPLAAALGLQVAKLAGRGLGHTGGTLDKLEAIPGLRVDLTPDALRAQVAAVGLAIAAASEDLVPLDRRIYALRDVTGTVPSAALIAASVMSKKVAGGAGHVLLDVKTGAGAFLPDEAEATALARLCVAIGRAYGRQTAALVTDMSQPLGGAVGNALEVRAAIDVLAGEGTHPRLAAVSHALLLGLLELTGRDGGASREELEHVWRSGQGLEKFREFVQAQGGDPRVVDDPTRLPVAPVVRVWEAPEDGFVTAIACRRIGEIAGLLGAGRQRPGDVVDPAVGLEVAVQIGDPIERGAPMARIHARSQDASEAAAAALSAAIVLGPDEPALPPLIRGAVR